MFKRTHIRVLSLLLVFSMMLSVMPASAATDEQEPTAVSEAQRDSVLETESLGLDEKSVPEIVGFETARDRGHVLRLRDEEQGHLNKLIFLSEDGSRTMYLYDHPVKYVDEQGMVKDISLEIADTGNSAQPFRTASGAAVTTFSADLSGGITLSSNSTNLRLVPETGGRARPASRLNSKTIQYPYGTYTTIEYSLTYTGFKEDIVVSQYTGQTEYPFRLYTNGLALAEIDGSYYLTDTKGNIQATIGDIIVLTADDRNNTLGELRAETIVPNQEYRLTIVLDLAYLSDPDTAYPIRIDPTIDINYDDNGDDAILDLTLFSNGTSSITSGSLTVGNHETKGTARAVMSFPGLDLDSYGDITISSATVYVRDLLCESTSQYIECCIYNGAQWGSGSTGSNTNQIIGQSLDGITFNYENGYALNPRHYYGFDITEAVQGWHSDFYEQEKGIIFLSSSLEGTSTYQCRTIASFNRANYKPHLEMVYYKLSDGITSVNGKNHVTMGGTMGLVANGVEGNITWTSSNTSIATVNANGLVMGLKAGKVIITARCPDYLPKTFVLWVTLPDGAYFLRNAGNAPLYLENTLTSGVTLATKEPTYQTQPSQLWYITYDTSGMYALRSLKDTSQVLRGDYDPVTILDTEPIDFVVPIHALWTIDWDSSAYYIRLFGLDSHTLQPTAIDSGASVTADDNTETSSCKWTLETPTAVYVRNNETQELVNASSKAFRIELDSTKGFNQLGFTIEVYGGTINSATWTINNNNIATKNGAGNITGVNRGGTVITHTASMAGQTYINYIPIDVVETISITNFYDSSITSNELRYIDEAVEFLNTIYSDQFKLVFEMDGDPILLTEQVLDSVYDDDEEINPPHPETGSCDDCNTPCVHHHNNLYHIADILYRFWTRNHLVVMWSNYPPNTFCYPDKDGKHTLSEALAVNTGVEIGNNEITKLPVIQILNLNTEKDGAECFIDNLMSVLLAHEVAHSLGLGEVYDGDYGDPGKHNYEFDENGKPIPYVSECIMGVVDIGTLNALCNRGTSALCDDCREYLTTEILDDVYEQ